MIPCDSERRLFSGEGDGSRRRFLGQLGAGFGTLAFEALQRQQLHAAEASRRLEIDSQHPFTPRQPHFTLRAKSVIFLFMVGGPSQIDTFDYKPELQRRNGQPLPTSIKESFQGTKFSNVMHGCKDELLNYDLVQMKIER